MPIVFRFDDITGYVYKEYGNSHNLPHLHAYYAEFEAVMDWDGNIIEGNLPHRKRKKIREWLSKTENKRFLMERWKELNPK